MELLLNEEQTLLRDSAAALIAQRAGPKRLRAIAEAGDGTDRALWRDAAAAGWPALLVPEEGGGAGLGMTELALVVEQCGRGLAAAPIAAAMIAARAVAASDSDALRSSLLPRMIDGGSLVVPALLEDPGRADCTQPITTAARDGAGFVLSGTKISVPGAAAADGFLISAVTPDGPVLLYLPANASGFEIGADATVDGLASGRLAIRGSRVSADSVVAGPNHAPEAIAGLVNALSIGLSAELLGVMEQALDIALEYLRVRKQFDRPIGSFQALQHRAADSHIAVEVTRSLLYQTCAAFDRGAGSDAMASALKSKASRAALEVTKAAIQFHGGIGFTHEHDIGLYLKRAMALSAQYGNATAHRRRYAELTGLRRDT